MKLFSKPILIVLLVSMTACGMRHDLGNVAPQISRSGSSPIQMVVSDKRPYVLNGDKTPAFIGLVRSGFGIPYSATTSSGNSLAEDMGKSACNSFTNCTVKSGLNISSTEAAHSASKGQKVAFLEIKEWKSDVHTNGELFFDLSLSILSAGGKVLGRSKTAGRDYLSGSIWVPGSAIAKATPKALKEKLEVLFNDPNIQRAL